ncbi:hypothetical protein FOA52_008982, partial [Chlamydomonas sp. UWO 241]
IWMLFEYAGASALALERATDATPIYDADVWAPARFFMLRKQEPNITVTSTGSPVPRPGEPGRWALPDDTTGIDALATLHSYLDDLRTNRTIYALLLCTSLIALVGRLLTMCTFQPRLAIIPLTLWLAATEIAQPAFVRHPIEELI